MLLFYLTLKKINFITMSNFQSYKTITDRLKSLGDKLSTDKLSTEELDEFESLSRQLFERALILNYKAKEVLVHGEKDKPQQDVLETHSEPELKEEKKAEVKEEEVDTGEIQFDFSSDMDALEDVDQSSESNEVEVKSETTPKSEIAEATEKVAEAKTFESRAPEDTINDNFDDEKQQSFYERFQKVHNESIGDRLGASKLSTLKNAIGLNDKMQFISELFAGETDAFNKSIEALDQQPSNEDARRTLSQIASKHTWDEENPLVEEFARLIERRYVEE